MPSEAIFFAITLFILRVINYSISTMRLVFISRGQRLLAATTAFFEAFIFAVVIAGVVNNLSNLPNLLAYCLGAAVGSYAGMVLESRFITSYSTVTIIASELGERIALALREKGYGVTRTTGEGKDGQVDILTSSTINRDMPLLLQIAHDINPNAFVHVEAARTIRRGWLPGGPPRR